MPSYSYSCAACGLETVKRYTAVPPEEKRKSTPCECGAVALRDYATDITSVGVTGGQKGGIEKEVGFSMEKDSSGRPIYRDLNGKVHEIRSSKDVDAWSQNLGQNPFAKPRMVQYRNPITGVTTWEPSRVGGLRPHPVTGEPLEHGQIIREKEALIPLGRVEGEYVPPSCAPNGVPLVNGVLPQVANDRKPLGLLDPVTGKPMTMADCWGDESGIQTQKVQTKRPPPGMKWS